MDGSSLLSSLSSPSSSATPSNFIPHFNVGFQRPSCCSPSYSLGKSQYLTFMPKFLAKFNNFPPRNCVSSFSSRSSLRSSAFSVEEEASVKSEHTLSSTMSAREMLPKIDKSGRFCSPRAARELALSIVYAACLEGSDPVRLFEKRINERREPGYEFDKEKLLEYNHMSFGGPPITVDSVEDANELLRNNEKESAIEEEVLAAPPKLVYSKLILRFARKLLVAVMDRWDNHVVIINKVVPANWKNEPAGRILELSILHLAMSEIAVLGTRHQIVINEAVDLAKRFCDGVAPRIINGCLRTFVKDLEQTQLAETSDNKGEVLS